jgi:transcriptional regulator with XRE-family HTH domain
MTRTKLPPTIRQRRLGAELRRLREAADLTATGAGKLLGQSQSRISNIESGGYAVSADRVRAMARAYTCTDEKLIEALTHYTGGRTKGWWEEYRDMLPPGMLDLAELEHHATSMRIATVIHLPGLLQTREHARAVISDVVPPFSPPEVEHQVSFRIKRQGVLYQDSPVPLTSIIHEAALHMRFGGPDTARDQLKHLLTMSERNNIEVLVIPSGTGTFPGSGQGIIYLSGEVPHLDTIQVDTDSGPDFLDTQPQLARYRLVLDRMAALCLSPGKSRDVIHRTLKDL